MVIASLRYTIRGSQEWSTFGYWTQVKCGEAARVTGMKTPEAFAWTSRMVFSQMAKPSPATYSTLPTDKVGLDSSGPSRVGVPHTAYCSSNKTMCALPLMSPLPPSSSLDCRLAVNKSLFARREKREKVKVWENQINSLPQASSFNYVNEQSMFLQTPGMGRGLLYGSPVFVCWGQLNKLSTTGQLNQQKSIVSQLWRLQVRDQGVSLVPSEDCEGRICARHLSLACRWMSSPWVSSHCLPSMHVCVHISSFIMISPIGLGPILLTPFELDYLCKGHISK